MSSKKSSGKDESADKKKTAEASQDAAAQEDAPLTAEQYREVADRFAVEADRLAIELATEKEKCLRLMAEYDNFRKRSQKEKENIYSDIRGDTVIKFLPVYDNLERAIKQTTTDEAYSKGVEMIMSQFREVMANLGVTEIGAEAGAKFDPEIHDAVMHVEDESLGEGVIAEEFQKGFKLGDKVLRFSVVKAAN